MAAAAVTQPVLTSEPEPALNNHERSTRGPATASRPSILIAPRPVVRPAPAVSTPRTKAATESLQESELPVHAVVKLPVPGALDYSFELRQQWEGIVNDVGHDDFSVTLRDTSNPEAAEYDAVLPIEEVPPDDLRLLQRGAVLYWTIGYERTRAGQVKRVSIIRLRRLPAWSKGDLERAKKRAGELDELFRGE